MEGKIVDGVYGGGEENVAGGDLDNIYNLVKVTGKVTRDPL